MERIYRSSRFTCTLPIIIPIILIPLFATIAMIQPFYIGLSVVDWMRLTFYFLLPIVYFCYLVFLYLKLKIRFAPIASILASIIGIIFVTGYVLSVRDFLVPTLVPVKGAPGIPVGEVSEIPIILRNVIYFHFLYFVAIMIIAILKYIFGKT